MWSNWRIVCRRKLLLTDAVFCRADLNKLEFLLQFHMPALDVHGSYRAELASDRQIAEWAKMFSSIRKLYSTQISTKTNPNHPPRQETQRSGSTWREWPTRATTGYTCGSTSRTSTSPSAITRWASVGSPWVETTPSTAKRSTLSGGETSCRLWRPSLPRASGQTSSSCWTTFCGWLRSSGSSRVSERHEGNYWAMMVTASDAAGSVTREVISRRM